MIAKTEWVLCPVCGNKTRDKIREDTILPDCAYLFSKHNTDITSNIAKA